MVFLKSSNGWYGVYDLVKKLWVIHNQSNVLKITIASLSLLNIRSECGIPRDEVLRSYSIYTLLPDGRVACKSGRHIPTQQNFHTANLRQPQKQRFVFFIQHIYPKYTIAPFKPIFKNPF